MNQKWTLPVLLLLLFSLGCGNSEKKDLVRDAPFITKTFTDDLDRQINLPKTPKRIISLAPSITETMYAMGAEDLLIARSHACDFPEWAVEKPAIQTFPALDHESILAFSPDLVLATDEIISVEEVFFFDQFEIPCYFQSFDSLPDVSRNIRVIGELLDRKEAANHLADSLDQIENNIVSETRDEVKYPTAILISSSPLVVAGGSSFMDGLIEKAGGKNVFGHLPEKYPEVTMEQMLKANVEYLIIPSRATGADALNQMIAQNPPLANMPAVLLGQVFDNIDPDLVYRPGPRTVQGLAQLTHILHSGINTSQFFDEVD